ncbi:hypothetical protein JCM11641_008284 [Rhodosporidiobolus odoratus]
MSYPPPTPANIPVSTNDRLPAGTKPISDTVGLISGTAKLVLAPTSLPLLGDPPLPEAYAVPFPVKQLKEQALVALKVAAKKAKASGMIEVGSSVEVKCEGVGILTVDTL